jgi:hypothetical protein
MMIQSPCLLYMLMYTIGSKFQPTMEVNIPNRYSSFESKYRGYFSGSADWNEYSVQEVDDKNTISVDSKSSPDRFKGALICKLQKVDVKSDAQFESIYTLLLIVWKYEGHKKFRVFVRLMECDKAFHWDKVTLEEYYQKYASQLRTYTGSIKDTWLLHDNTVLMTRLELDFTQGNGGLGIIISEGVKDEHTRKPEWIDPKR